jgi:hypothetical protein
MHVASVHRHKPERDVATFSPTAITGILVGCATRTNGYRILITNTGKVDETLHVDFIETILPGMPPNPDKSISEAPELQGSIEATVEPRTIAAEKPADIPANEPAEASIESTELESNVEPEPCPGIEHLLEEEFLSERERKPPQYLKDYVRPSVKRQGCGNYVHTYYYQNGLKE